MATIRSYTTVEQSKKLAEILTLESADMVWQKIYDENHTMSDYRVEIIPYRFYSGIGVPCWSLASLLNVLPSVIIRKGKRMFLTLEKAGAYNLYYKSPDRLDELWETKEDVVDACYEMIINLHEQKIL